MSARLLALLFTLSTVLGSEAYATQTVKLAWYANPEPDIAGYRLYFGTTSGQYDQVRDVVAPYLSLTDLADGVAYYFSVTAYNAAGAESVLSNEVSFTSSPTPTSTPAPTATPNVTPTPTPSPNQKPTPRVTPSPAPTPPPQSLLNISSRVRVQSGNGAMIGGFIISGSANKNIVIRALGPSLIDREVKTVLADPVLELYDSTGQMITKNNNSTSLPANVVPVELEPTDPAESVIALSLPPGSYTAVLQGANNSAGNALCELLISSRLTPPSLTFPPAVRWAVAMMS